MGRGERDERVGWGREEDDEAPPPEHAGPIWLNPRFVVPVIAAIAVAVAISIVVRDEPEPEPGPLGAATTTTTPTTTTTTTTPTTTTTTRAIPGGLGDFGDTVGLGPDDLGGIVDRMTPYDGPWYPGPGGSLLDPAPPGLAGVAVTRIPIGDGLLDGVAGGAYDLAVFVFDGVPVFDGAPGMGTQVGLGIACPTAPEMAGIDGFGGGGWNQLHFVGGSGYSGFDTSGGGFTPLTGGFGFAAGSTVVIGVPATDEECEWAASNFYRDEILATAQSGDVDAFDYQWLLTTPSSSDF